MENRNLDQPIKLINSVAANTWYGSQEQINQHENSSSQTASTAYKADSKERISIPGITQVNSVSNAYENASTSNNDISKLMKLIETEKAILKNKETGYKIEKKAFSEIKNNIQMIQENLDNFFVINFLKAHKKKFDKKEDN